MADEPLITIPFDPDFNTAIRPRCPGLNMRNVFQVRTATRLCRKLKTTRMTNYYGFKSSANCNTYPLVPLDSESDKARCDISTTRFTIDNYQSFCKPFPSAILDHGNTGDRTCHTLPIIQDDIEISIDNRYCYSSEEMIVNDDGQSACRKNLIIEDLVELYAGLNWLCVFTDPAIVSEIGDRACRITVISNYPVNISAIPSYIRYSCYVSEVVGSGTGKIGNKTCNVKGLTDTTLQATMYVGRLSCKVSLANISSIGKKTRCQIVTGIILTPLMFGRVGKGRPVVIGPIVSGRMNPKMRPAQ